MADSITNSILREWGGQWRRATLGAKIYYRDGVPIYTHVDGYPTRSLSNFGDQVGFGTKADQSWAEVYVGDGLLVQRALVQMGEAHRKAITITYGVQDEHGRMYPAKVRAECMQMSRANFWITLTTAEQRVTGFVEGARLVVPAFSDFRV